MKSKILKMGLILAALATVATTGVGHGIGIACTHSNATPSLLANSFTATDGATCVIEPLLTRSSAAAIYADNGTPDELKEANITEFRMTASGGVLSATIKVAQALPTSIGALVSTVRPPYGGVHVLALFQSDTLDVEQPIGGGANLGPFKRADGFHWFLYWGNTLSEGGNPQCGIGYYDPFGQLFFVITQDTLDTPNNLTCSVSGQQVTLTTPYVNTWTDAVVGGAPIPRSLKLVTQGTTIQKAKAFSWMDHEIGGPPPVGLVLGFTWYTDILPSTAYNFGAVAGDPNSGGVPGPTCQTYAGRRVPNPLYTGSACYIQTPFGLGTGYNSTPLTITAG